MILAKLCNLLKRKTEIKKKSIVNDILVPSTEPFKCSKCGSILYLLLSRISYSDPIVYKCNHCRCTITYPGTGVITDSGRLVPFWSKREDIINVKNGFVKFIGKIRDSVDWEYDVIYPHDAFSADQDVTYLRSEKIGNGMCVVECRLKPLKVGLFCVTEEIRFRGNVEESYVHFYLVE